MIKNIIAEYQIEHHGREDDSTRHKILLREMEENNYKKNIESKRKILDEMKNEQMTDDARRTMMSWITPSLGFEKQKEKVVKKTSMMWKVNAAEKKYIRVTRNMPRFDKKNIERVTGDIDRILDEKMVGDVDVNILQDSGDQNSDLKNKTAYKF